MPPIETGPMRPTGALDAAAAGTRAFRAPAGPAKPAVTASPVSAAVAAPPPMAARGANVERSDALAPGAPPVDAERVVQIRKAVESGTYPLLPTKIADAIIAAGYLLRTPK